MRDVMPVSLVRIWDCTFNGVTLIEEVPDEYAG